MTFSQVQTALMILAFGTIGVGDLFKGKDCIATYRLFNGLSAVFALAWINSSIAHQWATESMFAQTWAIIVSVFCALVFGSKAIESFKLAAEARQDRNEQSEQG